MLVCHKCKEHKLETDFTIAKRNIHRQQRQSYCKSCMSVYRKTWEQTHKSNIKKSRLKNKDRPINKIKSLLSTQHIDRSALDFPWVWSRLEASNFCCELTGIPFTWEARSPTTLSIDRIDPKIGYTKENVRFVCWWINAAMGNWGYNKLVDLIKESNIVY